MRVLLAVLILLFGAETAHAAWDSRPLLASESSPHAAVGLSGGGVALLADASTAERFSWTPALQRTPLPAQLVTRGDTQWAANARGDVLLVGESRRRIQGVLVEASGARWSFSYALPAGSEREQVAAALAEDGTAVVAWTRTTAEAVSFLDVSVALRRPGAGFDPVTTIPADGASLVAVAARGEGRVELAYAAGGIHHVELPGGTPVELTDGGEGVETLQLAGGRVLVFTEALTAFRRGADGAWSRQELAADAWAMGRPLAATADGAAVVVYSAGREVLARRAAPGGDFGPPQRLARLPREWSAYTFTAALGTGGHVLATWNELSVDDDELCGGPCHDRVRAAVAGPGTAFGAPRRISPLGSTTRGAVTAAISDTGERLVAFQQVRNRALTVLRGSGPPEPAEPADRRAPRVRVAQVRGQSVLRARVRCDEACEVRLVLTSRAASAQVGDLNTLEPVALDRAGTKTFEWRLTDAQQRRLRGVRERGRVAVAVSAVDMAGNRTERITPLR